MPLNIKQRGRPRGNDLTVIGIPKKRNSVKKPVSFNKLNLFEKKMFIATRFVESSVALAAVTNKNFIEKEQIQSIDKIPHCVLDENVDIYLIRDCFMQTAWKQVEAIIKKKKKLGFVQFVQEISKIMNQYAAILV